MTFPFTPEGKALNQVTSEPWADWEISMLIKHIEDPKNAPWLKGWSPLQQKLMLDGLRCLLSETVPTSHGSHAVTPRAWMNADGLISTVPGGGYVTPLYAAPQPVTSPDEISRVTSGPAVAAPDTRTPEGHRQRHVELHKAFDELFADYMRHHRDQHEFLGMPLKTLLQWSYKQTIEATE